MQKESNFQKRVGRSFARTNFYWISIFVFLIIGSNDSLFIERNVAASIDGAAMETAETNAEAICARLLSDEFFDDFYSTESEETLNFKALRVGLSFASDLESPRVSLDLPFATDCSPFDRYALTIEIDDERAIGSASLYLHSGDGWYSCSGESRRGSGNFRTYLFDAKNFRIEGAPDGLDQVDAIRLSFWRGANVDASVVFHSLRTTRFSFAVLDVDDAGSENKLFLSSFGQLLNRCGLDAGRVEASRTTVESMRRYSAIFLPIAGNIRPETVDALCEYVDGGGFVFAFYNAPEKLVRRLGFLPGQYVRCADVGVELGAMTFEPDSVATAKERGFELPEKIVQHSWNLILAKPNPDWESTRKSAIFGDSKARTLAVWTNAAGDATEYPAILASPNGFFCSHIFLTEGFEAQKEMLTAFVGASHSDVARRFLIADWRSIFKVGLDPNADLAASRRKTLDFAVGALEKKGWTFAQIAQFLGVDGANSENNGDVENNDDSGKSEEFDRAEFARFSRDVADIRNERVADYCRSLKARANEGRLWWEHSGCGIYPGDWDRTMKELADAGFNAVVPNMLWGGTAYYRSDVLPNDPKVAQYGDQIEQAVAAGKKYGVEVHVWKVCFNASNAPKSFLDEMRAQGRLQRSFDGTEEPWLCPSSPENRTLELASLEEVATKYDVDGIHFDYIRFPDSNSCYCDGCRERFSAFYLEKTGEELTGFPNCVRRNPDIKREFDAWRCAQITELVRSVRASLKEKRPDVLLSAAVFPGYPGTKTSIAQDWGAWIDEGLLDFACPMDYTSDPAAFARYVEGQLEIVGGKIPLYPGIGATATGIAMRPEEAVLQAEIARNCGAQGFTIFNLTKSTADAILPAFKAGATAEPTRREQ